MKKLKKLSLSKEKIAVLNDKEAKSVEGGLFKSRSLCFGTNSSKGCTSHTRCVGGGGSGVTIFCS